MKVTNIFVPVKKSSAKSKSTKKGDDSFETCLDIVPFESDLLLPFLLAPIPTGTLLQVSLSLLLHGHLLTLVLLVGPKVARGRHPLLLHPPLLKGEYVISNFTSSSLFFL